MYICSLYIQNASENNTIMLGAFMFIRFEIYFAVDACLEKVTGQWPCAGPSTC
jgi:hypothetical protein